MWSSLYGVRYDTAMNEKMMQIERRELRRVFSMHQDVGAKILGSALLLPSLCGVGRDGVWVMTENARLPMPELRTT